MIDVVNAGVSGNNTADALARIETEVIAREPSWAILFFGLNDALNSGKLVPIETYRDNLRNMIRRLSEHGIKSALITPHRVVPEYVAERHPTHPRRDALQGHLADYAAAVRTVAAAEGILCVDFRARTETLGFDRPSADSFLRCAENCGTKDGLHLMPAGYELLARCVAEVLRPLVRNGERIVCFGDSVTFGVHVAGAGMLEGESYPAYLYRILNLRC